MINEKKHPEYWLICQLRRVFFIVPFMKKINRKENESKAAWLYFNKTPVNPYRRKPLWLWNEAIRSVENPIEIKMVSSCRNLRFLA
ncbi:hypothetical protein BK120_29910 [Paenibacillus sp. FSL A5-0031]|nr:hypothetical protein BK120_29910 [Paenibacillus sp. FSL A5-0031]